MAIDFKQQRRAIHDELVSIEHNIGVRKREIAVLEQRRQQFYRQLDNLDSLESMRRHYGALELIRLCRTPAARFRPLDIDGILAEDKP